MPLSNYPTALLTLILTTIIEGVTCLFRFGFKLESTRDTASWVAPLTFGVRIHHGYIGVLLCVVTWLWVRREPTRRALLIIGSALALSDLIHHFVVLWLVTGDPQFDLTYPR
ncbi:MAG TPA: hypothetical protein PKO06_01545 [Candidatus Ozemobacteraceae bacterium]|nr:hypothetical protein [Candidatus Ozemobacteraceae bacterium]